MFPYLNKSKFKFLFFSWIGTENSLSTKVVTKGGFSLGATVNAASKSVDSETMEIKGSTMEYSMINGFWQMIPVR